VFDVVLTPLPEFPFLIGTVRTKRTRADERGEGEVSIPHRYGKNKAGGAKRCGYKEVSIPHRYGKNGAGTAWILLLGTLVSIPHRYGKNGC